MLILYRFSSSTAGSNQQRSENFMGVSVASSPDGHFMAGAPRWWIDVGVVYYRGRVSVFQKDNTVSYGTIPCEDGMFVESSIIFDYKI